MASNQREAPGEIDETPPAIAEFTALQHFDDISCITLQYFAKSSTNQREECKYHVIRRATDNTPLCLVRIDANDTMRITGLSSKQGNIIATNIKSQSIAANVLIEQQGHDNVKLGYIRDKCDITDSSRNQLVGVKIEKLENGLTEVYFTRTGSAASSASVLSPAYDLNSVLLRYSAHADCVTKVMLICYAVRFYALFQNDSTADTPTCDGSIEALQKLLGSVVGNPPIQSERKIQQIPSYGVFDTEPLLKANQVSIEKAAEHCNGKVAYFYLRDDADHSRPFYIVEKHYEPTELAVVRSVKFTNDKVFYVDKFSRNYASRVYFEEKEIGQVVDPGIIIHSRRNVVVNVRLRECSEGDESQRAFIISNSSTSELTTVVICHVERSKTLSISFQGEWDMEWRALIYAFAINTLSIQALRRSEVPKVQNLAEVAAMAIDIAEPKSLLSIEARLKAIELPSTDDSQSPLSNLPQLDQIGIFTIEATEDDSQGLYRLWDATSSLLLGFFCKENSGKLSLKNKSKTQMLFYVDNIRYTDRVATVYTQTANERSVIGYLSFTGIYDNSKQQMFQIAYRYSSLSHTEFQLSEDGFHVCANIYALHTDLVAPMKRSIRVRIEITNDCISKSLILCHAMKVFPILIKPWSSIFPSDYVPVQTQADLYYNEQELFIYPQQLEQFNSINLWPLAYSLDEDGLPKTIYTILQSADNNQSVCLVHTHRDGSFDIIDLSHSKVMFSAKLIGQGSSDLVVTADVDAGLPGLIGYIESRETLDKTEEPLTYLKTSVLSVSGVEHHVYRVLNNDNAVIAQFMQHPDKSAAQLTIAEGSVGADYRLRGLVICNMIKSSIEFIRGTLDKAEVIDGDLKHLTYLALNARDRKALDKLF